jgi:hypothetical protein
MAQGCRCCDAAIRSLRELAFCCRPLAQPPSRSAALSRSSRESEREMPRPLLCPLCDPPALGQESRECIECTTASLPLEWTQRTAWRNESFLCLANNDRARDGLGCACLCVKGALVCCVLKCLRFVCARDLRRVQHLSEAPAPHLQNKRDAAILPRPHTCRQDIDHPDPRHLTSDPTLGVCVRSSTRTTAAKVLHPHLADPICLPPLLLGVD